MREPEMTLVVQSVDDVAAGVKEFRLAPANGDLRPWAAGAHVDLVVNEDVVRQYSLCGDPADLTCYRIAVLLEEDGRGGSRLIHDKLDVGVEVTVRGPRNHFELEAAGEYLFVAGGIGITPILPMILAAERDGIAWSLVYGGRSATTMAFIDELSRFGDRVRFIPADEFGMLDLAKDVGGHRDGRAVYCCGPEGLLLAVEQYCQGWPRGTVHMERFAPRQDLDPASALSEFQVVFEQSGLSAVVRSGESVLEVATALGIEVVSSCEEGTCGTCEVAVLAGSPDHRDSVLDEAEREAGDCMMVCVSRSCSPVLVLDL